jgi:hypothetical protein
MYKNIEIINKIHHKDKYVKVVENLLFAKEQINAPITIAEFFLACKDYPIVFAKDAKTEEWFATVLLGIKDKNLFINDTGDWDKLNYIPAFFRRYPFIFLNQENSEELILGIDKEYLTKNKKDKKLFDDNENSEVLNGVVNFLNQYQNDAKSTSKFIKQLAEWQLLEEKSVSGTTQTNEQFKINGFYIVNEIKLKHLSKKRKEELCNKDLMPLITAHLISLSNIEKLRFK